MAENSKIEWTDHTFNAWTGCTKVGPGCDHCYAEGWAKRSGNVRWGVGEPRRRTTRENWKKPRQWNVGHQDFLTLHGRRQRVFCSSLSDVFDNAVPMQWRADLLELIAETPNLDWLLLTKRIGNAAPMIREALIELGNGTDALLPSWPWPNVWIGATVVSQEEADRDIPKLLATPAHVRFLSMEPLLGPVDLRLMDVPGVMLSRTGTGLSWVIVGGESGHGARPMHPDWARSLRDQCAAVGVPFLFKQWGEWAPGSCFPGWIPGSTSCDFEGTLPGDDERVWKVGKKAAGRLLDGQQHDGFPEA